MSRSSSDLGVNTPDLLKPLDITTEEWRGRQAAARRVLDKLGEDDDEILQMLGFLGYESGVMPNLTHGRRYTYNRHKCRCTPCNEANTAYFQERSSA